VNTVSPAGIDEPVAEQIVAPVSSTTFTVTGMVDGPALTAEQPIPHEPAALKLPVRVVPPKRVGTAVPRVLAALRVKPLVVSFNSWVTTKLLAIALVSAVATQWFESAKPEQDISTDAPAERSPVVEPEQLSELPDEFTPSSV
jgi:hypothetical protein